MKNKTILITGASSGIGKATAIQLAKTGAQMVLLIRNFEKGKVVQQEIIQKTKNEKIDLVIIDLADLKTVRKAAEEINEKYEHINVLINNAGGIFAKRMLSADGFEYTFAINHLGPFLLTNLLLDKIIKTPKARIINLSSTAHKMGHINFNDIMFEKKYSAIKAYGQSKLANILFTKELARILKDTNITVNAVHPGVIRSGFGKNVPGVFKFLINLAGPFMKTTEKGAETSVFLATSQDVERVSGEYFVNKKIRKSLPESNDVVIAQKLWNISNELTR